MIAVASLVRMLPCIIMALRTVCNSRADTSSPARWHNDDMQQN